MLCALNCMTSPTAPLAVRTSSRNLGPIGLRIAIDICSPRRFSLLLRPSLAIARRPLPVVAVLPALVARVDRDPEDGGADLVLHEELVVLRNVDVVLGQPLDAHRSHE